jgi:glycogen operon protein
MILMGDEVRRTQLGNNNAYCHDNETTWFDWTLAAKHADVHRFVKLLMKRRILRSAEYERRRVSLNQLLLRARKAWHGVKLDQPDWSPWSHSVAFGADLPEHGLRFHLILNAYWEPLDFDLPPATSAGDTWRRWIDTTLDSPDEIVEWQSCAAVPGQTYHAGPRSVVVLIAGLALEHDAVAGSL